MVKHMVMWRLRFAGDDERLERLGAIRRSIEALRLGVEGLKRVEIGFNESATSDAADLVLYSEFDSWPALQAYETHPLHEQLKRLIAPVRMERRVVDYEVG